MNTFTGKIYTSVLQFSILVLTWALVWFAFVYYPKIINNYKTGHIPVQAFIKPIIAKSQSLPIVTSAYRIEYDEGSQTYYVFIQGNTVNQYAINKNAAELSLKNTLSLTKLCSLNIIYASVQKLPIPKNLQNSSECS